MAFPAAGVVAEEEEESDVLRLCFSVPASAYDQARALLSMLLRSFWEGRESH